MNVHPTHKQFQRSRKTLRKRIALEPLEDRRLLTAATVDTIDDVVDIDPSGTMGDLPGPDNVVSLREALIASNNTPGADEINFDTAGVFGTPQAIALTLGELEISDAVTVNGTGVDNLTIDAEGNSRVLNIDDGETTRIDVMLSGLTLTGGHTVLPNAHGGAIRSVEDLIVTGGRVSGNSTAGEAAQGGGIFSYRANLTLSDSTISGNSTSGDEARGGGIFGSGFVTVTESTISGNSTTGDSGGGSGIHVSGGDVTMAGSTVSDNTSLNGSGGGIVARFGTHSITNSTISGNYAGFFGGGIWSGDGSLAVTNSTLSANTADRAGGGLFLTNDLTANISNSTISGNVGQALAGGGIVHYSGELIIRHSTVTANYAPVGLGSGIVGSGLTVDSTPVASTKVYSSIISGNVNSDVDYDVYCCPGYGENPFQSYGFNVIGTGRGVPAFNNNDQTGVLDPMLGPLADNGGPTKTHAVLPGSPALDTGDPDFATPPDFDQRGDSFARVFGDRIDVGAFESQPFVVDGDFNNDGLYDCEDIDALVGEIAAGTNGLAYDLTADGIVDLADRDAWLAQAGEINLGPGKVYLLGDANLDGIVDGLDFVAWNMHKFASVAEWCGGDFNADGLVDGLDFVEWNTNKFQSSDGAARVAPPPFAVNQMLLGGPKPRSPRAATARIDAALLVTSPTQPSFARPPLEVDAVFAEGTREEHTKQELREGDGLHPNESPWDELWLDSLK